MTVNPSRPKSRSERSSPGQFRPPKSPSESEQNNGAITNADQARAGSVHHRPDIGCQCGSFLRRRGADHPANALHRVPNHGGMGWRFQPHRLVSFGNRVQSPLYAPHLQTCGAFGDVGCDGFKRRWKRGEAMRLTPRAEVAPVTLVAT
jgi:hypothetical protein